MRRPRSAFRLSRLLFGAGLLALTAAARADAVMITDAGGRAVAVTDTSRIVSIGGAVTEILYALGLEQRVVAVDTTSLYPPRALADKPNVGYMRQLSAEGVLGLAPSLILATEGAGPKETVAVLERANVPFVSVPDKFDGDGVLAKIRLVAAATGAAAQGACIADAVKADLAALAELRGRVATPLRVLFAMSMVEGRPMVGGRATAADALIRLAGAVNAMDGHDGYKSVSEEAVIAAKPDAVLVMQRSQHMVTPEQIFAHPAFVHSPAAAHKRYIAMDGLYLLGFGPRTARAARDLAAKLYPELAAGALPSERGGDACPL
jgi:iron complex transport system substrate-binding protein